MECGQHGVGIRLARVYDSETTICVKVFITDCACTECSSGQCFWDSYFSLTSPAIKLVLASYFAGPFCLHLWCYRYEFPNTHNTHTRARARTHNCMCTYNTTSAAGRLLAAVLVSRHTLTFHFAVATSHATVSQCLYDCLVWKIKYPGWVGVLVSGAHHTPTPISSLYKFCLPVLVRNFSMSIHP
jgi:hypothetical protein